MILLLGSNGYIGSQFRRELTYRNIDFHRGDRSLCYNFSGLLFALKILVPELVINCAAYVAKPGVDYCEDDKHQTLQANLVAPTIIANACEVMKIPLMHLSSGCYYNGDNQGAGYSEDDPPQLSFRSECGIYVGSKVMAEEVVRWYDNTYICRIRLPFDEFDHERNYLSKLQRYPKVYSNVNSLSHRGDLVNACLDLWQRRAPFGTYNVTNGGAISAREIVTRLQKTVCAGRIFEFWDEAEFMNSVARTPKSNCVLSNQKLLKTGVMMPHVEDSVDRAIQNWEPELQNV